MELVFDLILLALIIYFVSRIENAINDISVIKRKTDKIEEMLKSRFGK